MLLAYFITAIVTAALTYYSRSVKITKIFGWIFYVVQAVAAVLMISNDFGGEVLRFFNVDTPGLLFFTISAVISPVVNLYGSWYLDKETLREKNIYNSLLILLCAAVSGVYFANNVAVGWIFLEATTLCTAGLIYHRRNQRSLEATWKYIFVCSVGIAIAYLGILLLGSMAGNLNYDGLADNLSGANPLFLKIAFLFILVGYSCKIEVFPLYTIGVDGNFAAPAPASAFISTALVNAGFISVFRVFKVMEATDVSQWISSVLVITGVLSILIGAFFLRRAGHFKRFLSYSTVENMGIALLGLGIGGIGVFAALLHVAGHSLLKSTLFLQMSRVGKTYGHYRIARTGGYMSINRSAATMLIVSSLVLLAFPPSPLFISELMIFKQMILNRQWWLLAVVVVVICLVMYNFLRTILALCYNPVKGESKSPGRSLVLGIPVLVLLLSAILLGILQPEWFVGWINSSVV